MNKIVLIVLYLSCSGICFAQKTSVIIQPDADVKQTASREALIASWQTTLPNINGDPTDKPYSQTFNFSTHSHCISNNDITIQATPLNTGVKPLSGTAFSGSSTGRCNIYDLHIYTSNILLTSFETTPPTQSLSFTATFEYDIAQRLHHYYGVSNDDICKKSQDDVGLIVQFDVYCKTTSY